MTAITQTRVVEMGAAAFVQHTSAACVAAMIASRYFDESLFPPDLRQRPDRSAIGLRRTLADFRHAVLAVNLR